MTNTAIKEARWNGFSEYECPAYGKEGCFGQELPLVYTTRKMSLLNDKIFHLLGFIASEGCWEEAMEYLKEHMGEEAPFEII